MESHTPNSMLLLNTVFMVACKHLPRIEDTMRAIEFRERVRGMITLSRNRLFIWPGWMVTITNRRLTLPTHVIASISWIT